jgi:hypothetical protein
MKLARVAVKKDINILDLKFSLRSTAKKEFSTLYFEELVNKFDIKNLGCIAFGQPDTWKSLITINPVDDVIAEILLDERRAELFEKYVIDDIKILINKTLNFLNKKEDILILEMVNINKERLETNFSTKEMLTKNKKDLEDFLQHVIIVKDGLEKIMEYTKKYQLYSDIYSNIMVDVEIKKMYYMFEKIEGNALDVLSPINRIKRRRKNENNINNRQK